MTVLKSYTKLMPLWLIFSGSSPFIAGICLLILGFETLPLLGNITNVIATYGLVIIVFLTGIHWGQQLSLGGAVPGLFISSNILAVLSWLSWLLLPVQYFLILLAVLYLVILIIDYTLYMQDFLRIDYMITRALVTGIVVTCLLITAALL